MVKKSGFLRDIKNKLPHGYDKMEGSAEGAGVPVTEILLGNP